MGATAAPQATRRLLTVAEVADRLRVSTDTVYRRISSGELPALAIGARRPLRIDEDALDAWLYGDGDAA